MRTQVLVLICLSWVVNLTPTSAEEPKGKVAESIKGKWEMVEVHRDGMVRVKEKLPDGFKAVQWEFGEGKLNLIACEQTTEAGKYKIDTLKAPKELDWTLPDGKSVVRCIYEIEKDRLRLCFQDRKDPAENKRPKGLRTGSGDGNVVSCSPANTR